MNTYELLFILNPDLSAAEAKNKLDDVSAVALDLGGEIEVRNNWEKQQLAYEVDGFQEGLIYILGLELEPGEVATLRRRLNTDEDILRIVLLREDS
ncbi:MAG: 30S ribosomal protein S6 [Patescibacteria group bacterium]